jgi:hypothetical protein
MSKYSVVPNTFSNLRGKIVLPTFQRQLVWSKKEKEKFIETLRQGFPFGSILVYKYEGDELISLIDGLQRYSTIIDYNVNPQNYVDFSLLVEKITTTIAPSNSPEKILIRISESVKNTIREYLRVRHNLSPKFTLFKDMLIKDLNEYKENIKENSDALSDIHDEFKVTIDNYLKLESVMIPTIQFTGDVSELATVFENLNASGKKLSKYQVFSAQWSNKIIQLSDDETNRKVLDYTIKRYKDLINSRKLEIVGFDEDEMNEKKNVNLSEFCYVFGKLILESIPIFWASDNEDLANQIGYSTLAIILGLPNKELNKIINHFDFLNNPQRLSLIVEKTCEIYSDLNKYFSKFILYPGENIDNSIGADVSADFQILSFFSSLWMTKYGKIVTNPTLNPISNYKKNYDLIKNNLIIHYINDIINSYWAGSGDSKLDLFVIDIATNRIKYLDPIPFDTLNIRILSWLDEITSKKSLNFDKVSKLIYTIYCSFYSGSFKLPQYDSEHIIPKYFLNLVPNNPIAGGSIGNLMFLDSKNNRGKKQLSLYENLKAGQKLDEEYFGFQEYPSESDFNKIKLEFATNGSSFEFTNGFIKNRAKNIINSLLKKLYPHS